jgi:hypothetical protein
MALTEEVATTDSLDCQLTYYRQPQLFPLIAEVVAATHAIETAYWRQEQAIEALAKAYMAEIEEAGA